MHHYVTPASVEQRVIRRLGKRHAIDRLDASRTALLVIDMQNHYVAEGFPSGCAGARSIVPSINRMSTAMRAAGARVIWVLTGSSKAMEFWPNHHIHNLSPENAARRIASLAEGGEGHKIYAGLEVHPSDLRASKVMYSAMLPGGSSNLLETLREHGVDTLLIAGTKTNVCCESTARDAYMLDFRVAILSDCTAASSDEEHAATLDTFQLFFGDVMNFDDVAQRLEPRRTAT